MTATIGRFRRINVRCLMEIVAVKNTKQKSIRALVTVMAVVGVLMFSGLLPLLGSRPIATIAGLLAVMLTMFILEKAVARVAVAPFSLSLQLLPILVLPFGFTLVERLLASAPYARTWERTLVEAVIIMGFAILPSVDPKQRRPAAAIAAVFAVLTAAVVLFFVLSAG